jgi:nicotinate-nucleotide adenylyltransferase
VRLAIFGGSFDPPHIGHLLVADDAFAQLGLDRLVFIPTAAQPLKVDRGGAAASAAHRLAMTRLLIEGDARFEVSTIEIERAGLSFTVDTLTDFAARYPSAERFLLLGADVLATFAQWREPERILQLARPVVLERAGDPPTRLPEAMGEASLRRLPSRRIDVSSTEIRERARAGKPLRGFVTDNVAAYIARHGLYR